MNREKPTDLDAALATMSADVLRGLVRELLRELDERTYARVTGALIARAARTGSGWAPAAVSEEQVAVVLTFVRAAKRAAQADPSEVDGYLRRGSAAFLRKDYSAAHRILGAIIPPVGDGEIDLGQRELVDDVLGADVGECAAQYVVSAYWIAPVAERAAAVYTAIETVRGVGRFWEPLREMERVAVEALPNLREFLPEWRALIANKPAAKRTSHWDTEEDRWLREVVQRLEGPPGLEKVARSTRRADDLRAWCKSLVDAGDWKTALTAFEEAAELVTDKEYTRGEFLDGAALAAQTVELEDVAAYLERAWRASPSLPRLRRWLGSSNNEAGTRGDYRAAGTGRRGLPSRRLQSRRGGSLSITVLGGISEANLAARSSCFTPILQSKVVAHITNVPEVSRVPRDERKLVVESDAGDHHVGHADGAPSSFQVGVDAARVAGGRRVEGEDLRVRQ